VAEKARWDFANKGDKLGLKNKNKISQDTNIGLPIYLLFIS
jgi:hypothetical protein